MRQPAPAGFVPRLRRAPAGARARRRTWRSRCCIGPAFVAAVAYVDPGNFATNFSGGARFGYLLLWVIVAANLMAMFVQFLSAKLGLATGLSLPELCRREFSRPVSLLLWAQAEIVAMATDFGEVVGGALAIHLLFGLPLLTGGLVTAALSFVLLGVRGRSQARLERIVAALLAAMLAGFAFQLCRAGFDPGGAASGLVPRLHGSDSVLLASGIVGATVMPHTVYLHSAMTSDRRVRRQPGSAATQLRRQGSDIVLALGVAGLINIAMLLIAAHLFFGTDVPGLDSIAGIHAGVGQVAGVGAATVFALTLLVSGVASTGVGTYAGQVIMHGFLRRRVPIVLRRAVTLAPALLPLLVGTDPTSALIVSQVILSFGIPLVLVPLVALTRRPDLMGAFANRPITTCAAAGTTVAVSAVNLVLVGTLVIPAAG